MSKISTSILLVFFALLIACEKTKLPPPEEGEQSISFYASGALDQQPLSDVTVSLYKKVATGPDYELVSEIGKTDSEGKFFWNYPKDLLNSNFQLVFDKPGYDRATILVTDPPQKELQVALNKVKENSLSIPFYVFGTVDNQPLSDVTVSLYKKVSTSPDYELVSEIGKTDSEGKLLWSVPKDSLNSNFQLVFDKPGYDRVTIIVTDPPQKEFQIAFNKTQVNPPPFSFYVTGDKDKQPVAGVTVSLYKKIASSHPLFPAYELVSKIGQTDAGGKLSWDYPKDSLNNNFQLIFDKPGYYRGSILLTNPPQDEFQIALNKVARVNFHLTYNNDTIPKKFHCYRQFLTPASYNSPSFYSDADILTTQSVTKIDKTLWIDLPLNPSQTIYCYMVDASTILNPSHNYPYPAQLKTFVLPSNAKDTTIVIEAFWK